MFVASYLQVAEHLVQEYNLQMPLYLYLKEFFKQNKKFGSRDRKFISELVFGFYRMPPQKKVADQLLFGSFLSARLPLIFFEKTNRLLASAYAYSLTEKIQFLKQHTNVEFRPHSVLSAGVNWEHYLHYLLKEKKVFIRIRQQHDSLKQTLMAQGISFELIGKDCLAFDEKIKLDELLPRKEDYVIQDWGTQQIGAFLNPQKDELWWDCCAASGGKSLLLLDKNPFVNLYASDIRPSILENLKHRLKQYHYELGKKLKVHDATKPLQAPFPTLFDAILCDAPCSGSGTWAQAPEQHYFFTPEKLQAFHRLQVEILVNALHHLKPNGLLYYITCSVWQSENELVIEAAQQSHSFEVLEQKMIDASIQGGDLIFISVLKKR